MDEEKIWRFAVGRKSMFVRNEIDEKYFEIFPHRVKKSVPSNF